MFDKLWNRRSLIAAGTLALLAGCTVVPKAPRPAPQPDRPITEGLPQDRERHRIALLVPLSGSNAAVGQSIANAATMALLDANAQSVRITHYDTGSNAGAAAAKAIADGNALILGPLLASNIPAVASAARPAKVPVISFSNDAQALSSGVFIMGTLPGQSVQRTIRYAASQGSKSYAALVPRGEYGQRASAAINDAARATGGTVVAMEPYDRGNTSVISAAQRLGDRGVFDAVVIADGGRIAIVAAPQFKRSTGSPRILGTELWSGDTTVTAAPALQGAWFAALSDARFGQFSTSYRTRFGGQPHRIATMGYDAVLLTLRIAREWKPNTSFPTSRLLDSNGFLGLDGPFRFNRNGVIERAFEVREVRAGGVSVVSPAPTTFGGG